MESSFASSQRNHGFNDSNLIAWEQPIQFCINEMGKKVQLTADLQQLPV